MSLGATYHLILARFRRRSECYTDIATRLDISLLPEYVILIVVTKGVTCTRAKLHDYEIVHDRSIIDDVQRDLLSGSDGKRVGCEGKIGRRDIDRSGWRAPAA